MRGTKASIPPWARLRGTVQDFSTPLDAPVEAPARSKAARARILRSGVAGGFLALAILVVASGGDVDRMGSGDGLIARYVAAHLSTDPGDVDPVVTSRGTSLRYGRIGLPAAIWVASAGRPSLMRYAHPAVIVLAAGAASAATAALFPGAGLLAALLPFLAPGFPLSIEAGFSEVLAVALVLWAIRFATLGRWWPCAAVLAAAVPTRENTVAILAALTVWALLRKDRRGAAILMTSLAPVAAWFAFVAARYGHVPPLDPYLRETTDTVGPPVVALIESLTRALSTEAAVIAAVHVAAGLVALALARASIFGFAGSFTAVQLLVAAPYAWRFAGEAARTSVFIQLFAILALAARLRPDWVPSATRKTAK